MSPASAGRFFTTELSEKPLKIIFFKVHNCKEDNCGFLLDSFDDFRIYIMWNQEAFILSIKFLMIFLKKKRQSKQYIRGDCLQVVLPLFYSHACLSCISVFGTEPDMIRYGSTIPIAKTLQDTTQKSVIMLPLVAVDDGEQSQNEISR